MLRFTLPWPPSTNRLYAATTSLGGRRLTDTARQYRADCFSEILRQRVPRSRTLARLSVSLAAFPPDRRARDIDNTLKASLDALQHAGVFEDDSQIDDLRIVRMQPIPDGRLDVTIQEIDS